LVAPVTDADGAQFIRADRHTSDARQQVLEPKLTDGRDTFASVSDVAPRVTLLTKGGDERLDAPMNIKFPPTISCRS
jgi:hypothetical protein